MNQQAMRLLDRWAGRPICFLLTVLRRIFPGRASDGTPSQKILFIKLVEQGATVLAYDALCKAADRVGRDNIYFCVFAENRPILDLVGIVPPENVFEIRTNGAFACLSDILNVVRQARRRKIDAIVDMEFFARGSAILSFLCGGERRVGCHRFTCENPYRGDLMTHRVQYSPYVHTAAAYTYLVEALFRDPAETPLPKVAPAPLLPKMPVFEPREEQVQALRAKLKDLFGDPGAGPYILLNPNPGDLLRIRKWPAERFIDLAGRIFAKWPKARLILTGTPEEEQEVERLREEIGSPQVWSVAGKTSFDELLTLYTQCDALVTNDSGPGHFASMTRLHVIVLFGPETPALFAPLGERIHVLSKPLACSPCLNVFNHRVSPCTDNVCMQAITVDEVFEVLEGCLEHGDNARSE